MTKRVPYSFVDGLPDVSARQLERNFQYLTDQLVTASITGWDAIIDPTQTADNTNTLVFTTVFAAMKYLADTKSITNMTLGLRNTATSVVEIGNYSGTTGTLRVRLIAIGGMSPNLAVGIVSPTAPVWDIHNFSDNSKVSTWVFAGLRVAKNDGAVSANATFLNGNVFAQNCYFDGQGASSTTVTSNFSGFTGIGCTLTDVSFTGASNMTGCLVQYNRPTGTIANSGSVVWLDTFVTGVGQSFVLQFSTSGYVIIDGPSQITQVSSPVMTVQITAAKQISIKQHTPITSGRGWLLSITSAAMLWCQVEGFFDELTTPVPVAASGSTPSRINAVVVNRADISGPATINLSVHAGAALTTYGVRFRGSGINGTVSIWLADSAAAATALDFIGALRNVITASITRVGAASSGHKQYAFDATSSHNILILEGDTLGAASTDAGANDLVITDGFVGVVPTQSSIDADFAMAFMMGTL